MSGSVNIKMQLLNNTTNTNNTSTNNISEQPNILQVWT